MAKPEISNSIGSNFSKTKNMHEPVGQVHFEVFEKFTNGLHYLFHIARKKFI